MPVDPRAFLPNAATSTSSGQAEPIRKGLEVREVEIVEGTGSSSIFMGQRNILQIAWRGQGPRPTVLKRSKPLL